MNRRIFWLKVVPLTGVMFLLAASAPFASDLWLKSCDELIRTAEAYQQDIKTVDMVLGAAIDAGNLEKIKSYKLRKEALRRQLDSVLSVIESKECLGRK